MRKRSSAPLSFLALSFPRNPPMSPVESPYEIMIFLILPPHDALLSCLDNGCSRFLFSFRRCAFVHRREDRPPFLRPPLVATRVVRLGRNPLLLLRASLSLWDASYECSSPTSFSGRFTFVSLLFPLTAWLMCWRLPDPFYFRLIRWLPRVSEASHAVFHSPFPSPVSGIRSVDPTSEWASAPCPSELFPIFKV